MQEQTPEYFRGRVFGTLGFLMTGAALLPVLFSAILTEAVSEVTLIAFLAIVIFVAAMISINPEKIFAYYMGRKK